MLAPRLAAGRVLVRTIVLAPVNVLVFGLLVRPARAKWRYRSWQSVSEEAGEWATRHESAIRRALLAALPGALADFIDTLADRQLAAELRAEMQTIEDARRS